MQSNWKTSFCSSFSNVDFHNFLIPLDGIFPFLPLSFVPVFSSLPPAHLLWWSSGHSHFKECFPFQSTDFLLFMFITLPSCSSFFVSALLISILLVARLNLYFCLVATWRKNEGNSSGHNIESKYVIFLLQNYWKNLFLLTVFQRIMWGKNVFRVELMFLSHHLAWCNYISPLN